MYLSRLAHVCDCFLGSTNDEGAARNKTMASALATFFKQVGCTALSKNNSILDHCPSFVAKDKKIFKFTKSKQKVSAMLAECTVISRWVCTILSQPRRHDLWYTRNLKLTVRTGLNIFLPSEAWSKEESIECF